MPHEPLIAGVFAAPGALAGAEGIAGVFVVLLWAIVFGLLLIWRATIGALFEHTADIMDKAQFHALGVRVRPLAPFAATLRDADWLVQQGLDAAAKGCEHAAVYLFNHAWQTLKFVGHEIAALAETVERKYAHLVERTLPHAIGAALKHTGGFATWILHEQQHVARIGRDWTHRELGKTNVRVHQNTAAITQEHARLWPRIGRLEHGHEATNARVKTLAELLTLAGFSAFMWRWMGKFGLRWLRCPAVSRIGRQIGCGGFGLLEDLLAASFTALALSDICTFAGALTRLAEWYRPLLMELVDVEDQLVGCHGASKPDPLGLPRLYLPPVPSPLPLG